MLTRRARDRDAKDNTDERGSLAVYQGNSAVHPTRNTILAALRPGAQLSNVLDLREDCKLFAARSPLV